MTSTDDGYCTCDGDDPRINASCGIAAHRTGARKVLASTDTRALIEEARGYVHPDSAHALYLIGCLADALESSEAELARLRSVVAGVEAAADEYAQLAAPKESYFARRLRSVLSDTKGDAQ